MAMEISQSAAHIFLNEMLLLHWFICSLILAKEKLENICIWHWLGDVWRQLGLIQAPVTPTLVKYLCLKLSFSTLADWHRTIHVHTVNFSCSLKGDCAQTTESFCPLLGPRGSSRCPRPKLCWSEAYSSTYSLGLVAVGVPSSLLGK